MVRVDLTIVTTNEWSFVLAAAHLYNSLRQSTLLTCDWDDMHLVLEMHGEDNLFVGKVPITFQDCAKHFTLAAGMPASAFARNKRQPESIFSRKNGRRLKKLAPVSRLFKGRYCDADGRTNLEPRDVIVALSQKATEEGDEIYHLKHSVDVCTLIVNLGLAIEDETLQVTFNHFEMHMLCWKLLRQLHVAFGPAFPDWSRECRDDRQLPTIVFEIMLAATQKRSVASRASEIMADFVSQMDELAQRDLHTMYESAAPRRAVAAVGVVIQSDVSQLLAT